MRQLLALAVAMAFLLGGPAWSAGLQVYVNNHPFMGKTSGAPSDLSLEASTVAQMLGVLAVLKPETSALTLEGEALALSNENGVLMLRGRDLARHFGGKYQYNPELGLVDITAYDPIANARKTVQSVLKQAKVDNDSDFQVLALLTRQVLRQQLSLDLKEEVATELVDDQAFARAGGAAEMGSLVTYRQGRSGNGTGSYRFFSRRGMTPSKTLGGLAWMWGLTWANLNSDARQQDLCEGFAFWTQAATFERLTGSSHEAEVLNSIHTPGIKEQYRHLTEQSKLAGVQGLLRYMRDKRR